MGRGFFDVFNQEFENRLPKAKTYLQAFEQTSESFIEKIGKSPYSSYDSYKSIRSKKYRKSK